MIYLFNLVPIKQQLNYCPLAFLANAGVSLSKRIQLSFITFTKAAWWRPHFRNDSKMTLVLSLSGCLLRLPCEGLVSDSKCASTITAGWDILVREKRMMTELISYIQWLQEYSCWMPFSINVLTRLLEDWKPFSQNELRRLCFKACLAGPQKCSHWSVSTNGDITEDLRD